MDRCPISDPAPPAAMVLIGPAVDAAKIGGQIREMMGMETMIQIGAG